MPAPRVLIIGCGVAGPVIALLLKRKGYDPVVLEKVMKLADAGGSLMMMPNGLKVLSTIGLAEVATTAAPHLTEIRDQRFTGEDLGVTYFPSEAIAKYGQPACGVKRTTLNLALKQALAGAGILVHEGWKLKDIVETPIGVEAISEAGRIEKASFLIGCDGIKAVSRTLILAKHGIYEEPASYTGLTQVGGMSPTPVALQARPGMLNLYGAGSHFICYQATETNTSWALTQRDLKAAQETWRTFTPEEMASTRTQLFEGFKDWASPVPELIRNSERIIKYGLYDRPQLEPEQWYSPNNGRCILIGDAAHPTSPHLGQGANQALEDCYHLARLLPDARGILTSETLNVVFSAFAKLRQPRTANLVKAARAQGENRVVDGGPEACNARDQRLRAAWADQEAVRRRYDMVLKEPF